MKCGSDQLVNLLFIVSTDYKTMGGCAKNVTCLFLPLVLVECDHIYPTTFVLILYTTQT